MNKARDLDTTKILQDSGWAVVRIWEHQPPEEGFAEVVRALDSLTGSAA